MDSKEIRRITGHTFANQQTKKESWYRSAIAFHEGANILGQHADSIPGGMFVFLTNAALSIELLLKAVIVANGGTAPITHELSELAQDAGVAFTKDQKATLELLGEMLKWAGRYPVPNAERNWDHYYDQIHEKVVIRERVGNAGVVRANQETFPSVKNYEMLWNIANGKWNEIQRNQDQGQE